MAIQCCSGKGFCLLVYEMVTISMMMGMESGVALMTKPNCDNDKPDEPVIDKSAET